MERSYTHYDVAGRCYGLSKQKVIALVNQHNLPKRKIYGQMAVGDDRWDNLMAELHISPAPGVKLAVKPVQK
jgi:hypothetical protein